jgi:plasmid stabilization system protein ParE
MGAFPHSGRMVPEYEISEVRQVIESSYRLIYLIKEDQIEVLAVVHTSRRELPQDE